MGRRARVVWGLAAPAAVALSAFVVAALATAGPTAAVLPPAGGQTAVHHKPTRQLAGVATTTGAAASTGSSNSLPADVLSEIRSNADWIMQSQLADGAIATYVDQAHIAPYGSGYAALGLARAAQVTGNGAYLAAAWRFLSWYQAHEDASGYTTDYNVTNGVETSNGVIDSTDAYAGMFLVAAGATWQASHDHRQLAGLASGIAGALHAIESTQTADGLTWAKPSYHAKYAMDQAETYAGLRAAAQLEQALGNTSLSKEAANDADRLQQGFAQLWVPSEQSYSPAVAGDGTHEPIDWSTLDHAMEEIWPVSFGLVTGEKAQLVVQRLASSFPKWDSWYWPVAGWAFQAVGRDSEGETAATSIEALAARLNHDWPFTSACAGQLIVLESGGFAT